jgi:hypothetical protein
MVTFTLVSLRPAAVPWTYAGGPDFAAWYDDTDAKSLEVFLELHRKMTPGERIARVFELNEFAENLQRDSVPRM